MGELQPGVINLDRIPVLNGALQIGIPVHPGTETGLSIIVGGSHIQMSRQDGQPLQIDDHTKPGRTMQRQDPLRLFTRPVSGLAFLHTDASDGRLIVEAEGLEIVDIERFKHGFLTQTFIYAYRQQHPGIAWASVQALLDKYES